jgi:hypothetical protein
MAEQAARASAASRAHIGFFVIATPTMPEAACGSKILLD